jgi:translation initiation factor IF-3
MIRTPQVRVVGNDGESLGILTVVDAIARAQQAGLDLVEVAPSADPPVCRIMDYGKFKYEKSKKAKEAKKKQHIVHLKEIKLHPKTEENDYRFKVDHARKFLLKGDRVKVTVVFRGREITHIDFGQKVLERVDGDLTDIAVAELLYKREGRNLISNYLPDKIKIAKYKRTLSQEKKAELEQAILEDTQDGPDQEGQEIQKSQPATTEE